MALRVLALAPDAGFAVAAALGRPDDPALAKPVSGVTLEPFAPPAFARADVWIEFAHASITEQSALAARSAKRPLLVCTTGLEAKALDELKAAAKDVPIMVAANTSLGVAVLNAALRLCLRALGPKYAAEIVELHHDQKKDAPSGTAMRLADTIQDVRGGSVVSGRSGMVGARKSEEIGVFAVRGGNVIGEHTVFLLGENDRIELTHRAASRDLFATGALHAAAWLRTQPPGYYSIEDCLGLK